VEVSEEEEAWYMVEEENKHLPQRHISSVRRRNPSNVGVNKTKQAQNSFVLFPTDLSLLLFH